MKSPVDVIKGRIIDINQHGKLTIEAYYPDWRTLLRRQYRDCNIQMIDGRPMSDKQRRTCYKLLREIAAYTGMGLDSTKEWMKHKFVTEELNQPVDMTFSLSDAPMSMVCAYQRFLINFILDWEIPCSFSLLDFADDINSYIYSCLVHKKCCICGQHSDLHHVDRVGMGGDREEMIHEGMEALPLCRGHHSELHQNGDREFYAQYHITKGVVLDKFLCKLYKLKTYEGDEYTE